MAEKKGSPRKSKRKSDSERQILKDGSHPPSRPSGRRRSHATRSSASRSGCCSSSNTEVRKGLGAVVFVLAFPLVIAGIIMTVVDANDNDRGSKYPAAFAVVGPILIALAVIFLVVGFILSSPTVSKALMNCFDLDNPRGFCRVHCSRLSHCLKPDDIVMMNQHAMHALKSEPGKSVLKRGVPNGHPRGVPNGHPRGDVDINAVTLESGEPREPPPLPDTLGKGVRVDVLSELAPRLAAPKGVRFSESDADDYREARTGSVTSTDSVLSLRNCKVHPKSDIWWTDPTPPARKVLLQGGDHTAVSQTQPTNTTDL